MAWLAVAACLVLTGCGPREAGQEHYRLTYSVFFPSVHVQSRLAQSWADEIAQASGGRLEIIVFPGGVLSGAAENYDCVVNGVSDLGMSCLSYSRGLFPLSECLDLPLGYPSGRVATMVANDFIRHFAPAEFDECHLLYIHAHGPGVVASRRPVLKLEDFRHLSIRGTGVTARLVQQLGGNAVGLPQGETFEALRKGVVEATLCPVETLKGWKQGEVVNDITRIPAIGYTTAMYVAMNRKSWEALPPELQQVIEDACARFIPLHGRAWDEADEDGRRFVEELGGRRFHCFSPEENARTAAAIEPMIEEWIANAQARGLPGREAVDFIRERIAFHSRQLREPPEP
mgnify:FL=1